MNINATLIGQIITFAIFVWFCMKFVWPHLLGAMQEREKKIADGLDAANRAARDLELAQEKASDQLRESKEKAAEIIANSKKIIYKSIINPLRILHTSFEFSSRKPNAGAFQDVQQATLNTYTLSA